MKTIVTTGGLGDALICLVKIQQEKDVFDWIHGTGHTEHINGITDMQGLLDIPSSCKKITKKTLGQYETSCLCHSVKQATIYMRLNTKITEMRYPFLDTPLVKPIKAGQYCIQMTAGRMCDNTKRTVSTKLVKNILDDTPDTNVVLIGPEKVKFEHERCNNMTGKTKSILDAFAYIGGCNKFIGQDGICCYYAAFLRKETILNYHLPNLVHHYWNKQWDNHVTAMCHGAVLERV